MNVPVTLARFTPSVPRCLALALLGALLFAPAVARAAQISAELPVDAPIAGPSVATQANPSIAFDGTNYLVVWADSRRLGVKEIFGARVSAAGAVLDPVGFPISSAALADQNLPRVAFDGTNFLVVWQREYAGVWAARVSRAGVVLDPANLNLATSGDEPAVAFGGTDYMVAWATTTGLDVVATRVSTAGAVLSAAPVTICNATGAQQLPRIAQDSTNYFVVWDDARNGTANVDIYGARVSKTLAVLDANGFAISSAAANQVYPVAAFDGTNFLVAWEDLRASFPHAIYAQRVSSAAAMIGAEIEVTTSGVAPDVAFDGTNQLVGWSTGAVILGARVSPAGVVMDATAHALSPSSLGFAHVALARGATSVLAAWDGYPSTGNDNNVYAARIATTGTSLDAAGILVSTAGNAELAPVQAFDGTHVLAVWVDDRGTDPAPQIYGERLSASGAPIDASAFAISLYGGQAPAIAFDGTNYLVIWLQGVQKLVGARVSPAGVVLDPAGFTIATTSTDILSVPTVAFGGGEYLVAWQDQSSTFNHVLGSRVTPAGVVLDSSAIGIATASVYDYAPAIAFNGTSFLVAWQDAGTFRIVASRMSIAGALLDATPLVLATTGDPYVPTVASDGNGFLVSWLTGSPPALAAGRVSGAGAVLDPGGFAVAAATATKGAPSVCFDGTYLAVWPDGRGGAFESDIYSARITSAGAVLDPDGVLVSHQVAPDVTANVGASGTGSAVVLYQRFDAMSPAGAFRVESRAIESRADGLACTVADDCASNFCVDGVCCDRACGNGDPDDCEACSIAAGASVAGTCAALDATACDDGNACTTGDRCHTGACEGAAVDCAPADDCHTPGVCDPTSGACSSPPAPDGTACTDGTCSNAACSPDGPSPSSPTPPGSSPSGCAATNTGGSPWGLLGGVVVAIAITRPRRTRT